jgi:hypothetical protein
MGLAVFHLSDPRRTPSHHAHPSYALSIINMLGCGTAIGLMLVLRSMSKSRVPLSAA